MDPAIPDSVLRVGSGSTLLAAVLWGGLVSLSIALILLARTRWGQSQPLRKCVVLSLFAHALLAVYATTVSIVADRSGTAPEPVVQVTSLQMDYVESPRPEDFDQSSSPWKVVEDPAGQPVPDVSPMPPAQAPEETARGIPQGEMPPVDSSRPIPRVFEQRHTADPVPQPEIAATETAPSLHPTASPIETPQPLRVEASDLPRPAPILGPPPSITNDEQTPAEPLADVVGSASSNVAPRLPTLDDIPRTDAPAPELSDRHDAPVPAVAPAPSRLPPPPTPPVVASGHPEIIPGGLRDGGSASGLSEPGGDAADHGSEGEPTRGDPKAMPPVLRLRVSPEKVKIAQMHGATAATEAAVKDALTWLAAHQNHDGGWQAARFGAGREMVVDGQDRNHAGAWADTGATGLALLAFLGAGHTHLDGSYRTTVGRALDFIVASQTDDGSLGGKASTFAFMYCHGMATLALSEAYAMTRDERLEPFVRRAINYTVQAQHPTTGGWRYRPWRERPQDPGDMSQFGWQAMALRSAELAGVPLQDLVRQRMMNFVRSASAGVHGGLSAYQPGRRVSGPMTAEALVCRQFLGMADRRAEQEAADFVLASPPDDEPLNLYYLYYGTLALFQLQDERWEVWNHSMQASLLPRQRRRVDVAGSWDPDTVWGNYGGRVYSTALAALCLEVYYRYLPIYTQTARRGRPRR